MSNMSLYNDDHDDEIGPAPAGPAESAHNMTLESRFSSSSATLAEMRLNRTLMERSIPIQLISATLAEMRLKRR